MPFSDVFEACEEVPVDLGDLDDLRDQREEGDPAHVVCGQHHVLSGPDLEDVEKYDRSLDVEVLLLCVVVPEDDVAADVR